MFDLRYHVASLAAVFLALVIGILVGVGISRSGITDKADLKSQQIINARLEGELNAALARADELKREQDAFRDSYGALMAGRLAGKRIVLLLVGSDDRLRTIVEQTLLDAGAEPPARMKALKVPIDLRALRRSLAGRPGLARYARPDQLEALGRALGDELVTGGPDPLWSTLSAQLVEEQAGGGKRSADGAVIVRSAKPQQGQPGRFLSALYDGVGAATREAVGVESSAMEPSAIRVYRRLGLSSVDDVDTPTGRLALAILLAGGRPGHYGLKDSAEDLMPPVSPVAPPARPTR